ncbi:MAG: ABC transporter ATP-binding protein [Chloroflexi bacterium]|nr:ABC transporter ATP-binding protein [Chloroflexota bacterium]
MGFVLDGLGTESYDREYRDRDLLARIAVYFLEHRKKIALVVFVLALNSLAGSAVPIAIARAIDIVAVDPSIRAMALACGAVLFFGSLAWTANFIQQWVSSRIIGDVVLQLRADVFQATIEHDMSFFQEHPSGKIVSRLTSDTQDFSNVVSLVVNLLSQVLITLVMTVWLLTISPLLTGLLYLMVPIAMMFALSFRRVARRVTQRARRVTAKINAQIQESISGIMIAKSFRKERAIYETFAHINRQAYQVGLRRGLTLVTIFPIMGLSSGIGTAVLVFIGGQRVSLGDISPGEWYLFMQAVAFFWFPMMSIASFWSQFQDGLAAAERVFALIDLAPKVVQRGNLIFEEVRGEIEFRQVNFSYTDKEQVLSNFSLLIKPGETLALVGHTGAGKSSIVNLIARFFEFQSGEIRIDQQDIRNLNLAQYRRHLGLVPQEPFLFSGTVAENIRNARPGASDDEVYQAAEHISNGEWLMALPQGLQTRVNERGSNLSMGQRQLIALARVLLKDASILILDEATASVDPFTEAQIQEGLRSVMRDRTSVIIAHRLWTVQNADRIIVLDHGRILAEGTHASLMAQGGHYADLYNTYFRHQSLEYIEEMGA